MYIEMYWNKIRKEKDVNETRWLKILKNWMINNDITIFETF